MSNRLLLNSILEQMDLGEGIEIHRVSFNGGSDYSYMLMGCIKITFCWREGFFLGGPSHLRDGVNKRILEGLEAIIKETKAAKKKLRAGIVRHGP